MALALLRLDDTDPSAGPTIVLDTGTSTHFRIHLGKEVRRDEGFTLLDGPYWSSPLQVNPAAGRHVDTTTRVVLDPALVTEPHTLIQLESCRGADGHGSAYSMPVPVPGPGSGPTSLPPELPRRRTMTPHTPPRLAGTMSVPTSSARTLSAAAPRTGPVRSAAEVFSRPASIGDLISRVVQAAAPLVLSLLNQNSPASSDPSATLLTSVLRSVLSALAGTPAAAGSTTPAAPAPAGIPVPVTVPPPPVAAAQSASVVELNRFVPYARPMIFGIDDALIGVLAGPILSNVAGPLIQLLPQLMNSANQTKLARAALTNQQVSDLLSQVDRTMLLQQLISAQTMPGSPQLAPGDLAALAALLQTSPTVRAPVGTAAPATPAAVPTPAVARTQSLSTAPTPIASRAVLSMVTGPAITVLGAPRVAFTRTQPPTFTFRLDVGTSGPSTSLPRAILDVCVREPGGAHELLRRSQRITDLAPGTAIQVPLTAQESSALPADTDLEVMACLRWRGARGTFQATCLAPVMVLSPVQVKERGNIVGPPVELTDMSRFRGFWNKVWSSSSPGPLWALDLTLRYSVVTTTGDRGNGLMQARLQARPGSDDGLRITTSGRLRSGLEVSIAELDKLLPLWPGEGQLAADDLAALAAPGWLAAQGGDATTTVKMEGLRGTTGQLWVVPVPRLRAFTLAQAADVDPSGQVLSTRDHVVHFPVVESMRLLGLTSRKDDGVETPSVGDSPGYHFDGYEVLLSQVVGFEPAHPLPTATG